MTNRFHYMSDLHIEFGQPRVSMIQGDYLILAGDITVLRCLNPVMNDEGNRKTRKRTLSFFDQMQSKFKKVFYLTGNHESYNFDINQEKEYIAKYLPGVVHLDDTAYDIDEKTVLFGGTLWTDMNKSDPRTMGMIGHGMNDFRIIYNNTPENPFAIWRPEDAAKKHARTMLALIETLETNHGKNVIVATHHSPTPQGINREHVRDTVINHGYYTDLEAFIESRPQIKYWVFGHTHMQDQFEIGSTKVVTNAQGYVGYENCAERFQCDTYFDL